jgi:hypothetical protein
LDSCGGQPSLPVNTIFTNNILNEYVIILSNFKGAYNSNFHGHSDRCPALSMAMVHIDDDIWHHHSHRWSHNILSIQIELFYFLFSSGDAMEMRVCNTNQKLISLCYTFLVTAAIIFTASIIFTSATIPVLASTTGNTTITSATSPGLELKFSIQPIWDEHVRTTNIVRINQTHSIAEFEGNGTMTVPDTGQTIKMTNNGAAIGSLVPGANDTISSYGREHVFSVDDEDTSAITFFELVKYNPTTFEGEGLAMAVFDRNATGSLAPFNGMMVVGTHDEDPTTRTVTIRLWEWEPRIPLASAVSTIIEESRSSPMNIITTNTTSTASDTDSVVSIPIPP